MTAASDAKWKYYKSKYAHHEITWGGGGEREISRYFHPLATDMLALDTTGVVLRTDRRWVSLTTSSYSTEIKHTVSFPVRLSSFIVVVLNYELYS